MVITCSFDRVCVASFNSERLKRVRSMYPDMCISMGPNEVIKTLLSSFGLYNGSIDGDCLQIPIRYYGVRVVTKRFVNFLKSKGLKIMVWTINDVKTFKYLIDLDQLKSKASYKFSDGYKERYKEDCIRIPLPAGITIK